MEGVGGGGRDHYDPDGCFKVGGAQHGRGVLSRSMYCL